jgi:hypothetical protein
MQNPIDRALKVAYNANCGCMVMSVLLVENGGAAVVLVVPRFPFSFLEKAKVDDQTIRYGDIFRRGASMSVLRNSIYCG